MTAVLPSAPGERSGEGYPAEPVDAIDVGLSRSRHAIVATLRPTADEKVFVLVHSPSGAERLAARLERAVRQSPRAGRRTSPTRPTD